MPKYKAVIFDFDDTLADSRLQKWAHHRHVAKTFYNIDLTDEKIKEHWGKPLDTLISALYQESDSLEKMYEALISVRDNFLKRPFPGAADAVSTLLQNGLKVAILSATNKKFLVQDVERLEFPIKQISIIQGADETSVHKPDPKVLDPIFSKFAEEGINKNEIVCVGDSIIDCDAAQGAGIDFIAVTKGLYSKEDFKKRGVKVIIDDIREVVEKII